MVKRHVEEINLVIYLKFLLKLMVLRLNKQNQNQKITNFEEKQIEVNVQIVNF